MGLYGLLSRLRLEQLLKIFTGCQTTPWDAMSTINETGNLADLNYLALLVILPLFGLLHLLVINSIEVLVARSV